MVGVWAAVTTPTLLSETRTIQDYEQFKYNDPSNLFALVRDVLLTA